MVRRRPERVAQLIAHEIAKLLTFSMKDPRLRLVNITHVQLSDDLRLAKVYFHIRGKEKEMKEAQQGLHSARGYIKKELARSLRLRYLPELKFIHDDTLARLQHIEDLIKMAKTRGVAPQDN